MKRPEDIRQKLTRAQYGTHRLTEQIMPSKMHRYTEDSKRDTFNRRENATGYWIASVILDAYCFPSFLYFLSRFRHNYEDVK